MSIEAITWAWQQKCKPMEKLILVLLADHLNGETARLNPGMTRLAERSGMTKRAVITQLASLEKDGILVVERKAGMVNNYRLPVNFVHQCSTFTSEAPSPPPVNDVHHHQCSAFTGPVNDVHPNRKEPQSKPEVKPEKEISKHAPENNRNVPRAKFNPLTIEIPESLNTPEFREAWGDYVQHRKEKKKPVTEISAKNALKNMLQWGHDSAVVSLRDSCANGWQGIFEPKLSPTEAKKAELAAVDRMAASDWGA